MARPKKGVTFDDRVSQHTIVDPVTGCWEFRGHCDDYGYGYIRRDGRLVKVHRSKYQDWHGPVPDDIEVCHTCDNPPCWNPAHLFAGTHGDNMRDRSRKGRDNAPRGSRNGSAKLDEAKVSQIKRRLLNGETCAAIGREFGVTDANVGFIKRGLKWRHVEAAA